MPSLHLHPPFRAEHVGSLLRPKALYEKRQALEAKECSLSDLKPVEDEAIKHVVKLQQEIGIKTITDGELRRFVGKTYHSVCSYHQRSGNTFLTVSLTNSKAWYTYQTVRSFSPFRPLLIVDDFRSHYRFQSKTFCESYKFHVRVLNGLF